jgi:hypothetical protein
MGEKLVQCADLSRKERVKGIINKKKLRLSAEHDTLSLSLFKTQVVKDASVEQLFSPRKVEVTHQRHIVDCSVASGPSRTKRIKCSRWELGDQSPHDQIEL